MTKTEPGLQIDAVGVCVPGPEANYVEDDYRVAPALGLALLSSGMGAIGGQGRPAAKLAIWSVVGHVELQRADERPVDRMRAGLARAHEAIARLFPGGQLNPPPASFAGVLVEGRSCVVAHIGAARVYHLRGSTLRRVTEDHNLARECAARGLELPNPGYADIFTRALGFAAGGGPRIDEFDAFDVEPGDRLLLCTKHVRAVLDDDALIEIATQPDLDRARAMQLEQLDAHASSNRFRANTVIIAELRATPPEHGDDGASQRPPRSWLYDPGEALAEPPGSWPGPDAAWFRDVYGVVMGDDG